MRNIDKIKKMSSKELAKFLFKSQFVEMHGCVCCAYDKTCSEETYNGDKTCVKGIRKWLKQEAK